MDLYIKTLLSANKRISSSLRKALKNNEFEYQTFGKDIENYVTEVVIDIFEEAGLIRSERDYHLAHNKNEFPELTLLSSPKPIAIDVKSGNTYRKKGAAWRHTNNSNNDLGTLNTWPKKLSKFGGHIYFVFIIYEFNDKSKKIKDIQIGPFHNFLALSKEGVLRYREKDGNLRPRNFYAKPPIKSFEHFKRLLKKTAIYRAKRIIRKQMGLLTRREIKELIDRI